jgi:hypothetical protein
MSSAVKAQVLSRIASAPVQREPFPYCVIDGVFPADFYESIIDQWPQEGEWRPLSESGRVAKGAYAQRMVVLMNEEGYALLDEPRQRFWRHDVGDWLLGEDLRRLLLEKFASDLEGTDFGATLAACASDALIVSDRTDYAIGPHTDSGHRVVSLLFYLPEDETFRRFGTSFYTPRDPSFRCRGGPHHPFSVFELSKTIEFIPNRLVVFPKSDRCFHGVQPVDLPGIDRRLLIYNVRRTS